MQNEMTENFRINSTDDEFLTLLEGCYKQLFSMATFIHVITRMRKTHFRMPLYQPIKTLTATY